MYELGLQSRVIIIVSRLCGTVSFAVHIHHILMGTNCGDQERDHLKLPLEKSVPGINMRGTLNPFSQMLLLLVVVIQGGNVKVVKGDGTTASDPSDALAITRAYPHTYAQPLVQLVAADAGQVKKHSPLRFFLTGCFLFSLSVSHCDVFLLCLLHVVLHCCGDNFRVFQNWFNCMVISIVLHGYDPFSMNLLQNNPSFDFVLIKSPQECDLQNEPWWSGYFETVDDVVLCSYS